MLLANFMPIIIVNRIIFGNFQCGLWLFYWLIYGSFTQVPSPFW